MTRELPTALVLATSSLVCSFTISCRSETVAPSIEFTIIPKADAGGPGVLAPVTGRVKGARPNQRIVLFARSDEGWWVQQPMTTFNRCHDDAVLTDRERRDRERTNVMRALVRSGGRIYGRDGAAELLGINPTTLASRLRALKIDVAKPRSS